MKYANEYDIEIYWERFGRTDPYDEPLTPNLARAARTLGNLADWANENSDGWAYWPKPVRAAKSLITTLETASTRARDESTPFDIDAKTLTRILTPIKAFLTRQNVDHTEVIA